MRATDKTFTIGDVVGSFGTLLENLLKNNLSEDLYATVEKLFDNKIHLEQGDIVLTVNLQGQINTRDQKQTNIVIEIKSEDNSVLLALYYIGAKKAVYIDTSGLLTGVQSGVDANGNPLYSGAKLKLVNIDLAQIVDNLFDQIGTKIIDAINNLEIFKDDKDKIDTAIANNEIIIPHNAYTSAEDGEISWRRFIRPPSSEMTSSSTTPFSSARTASSKTM